MSSDNCVPLTNIMKMTTAQMFRLASSYEIFFILTTVPTITLLIIIKIMSLEWQCCFKFHLFKSLLVSVRSVTISSLSAAHRDAISERRRLPPVSAKLSNSSRFSTSSPDSFSISLCTDLWLGAWLNVTFLMDALFADDGFTSGVFVTV